MANENVELVRRGIEAAICKPPDWDTVNAVFDVDHEYVNLIDGLEGEGSSHGAAGWRSWLARLDATAEWSIEAEEFRAAPDGRIVGRIRIVFRGSQSGAEVEQTYGLLVTVRDGRVVRTETGMSWEQALEAAGLSSVIQ